MTTTQRRLACAAATVATTGGATHFAWHAADRERRPLGDGCRAASLAAALPLLRAHGVAVVASGVVDAALLDRVRATQVYASMPTRYERASATRLGRRGPPGAKASGAAANPQDLWPTSARGRYHRREESFVAADRQVFDDLEHALWPLVEAFFAEDDAPPGNQAQNPIFRSELQVLNAVPGSFNQAWHRDNQSRGLTLIVPLVDFTADNGPTQVLVGSHLAGSPAARLQAAQAVLAAAAAQSGGAESGAVSGGVGGGGARVVQAPAGAVAAYDSRTFHRGLGNATARGRPAVIFCYDRARTPPPGCGPYESMADAYLAGWLNLLTAGWLWGAT